VHVGSEAVKDGMKELERKVCCSGLVVVDNYIARGVIFRRRARLAAAVVVDRWRLVKGMSEREERAATRWSE